MQLASAEDMLLECGEQGCEQLSGSSNPSCKCRTTDVYTLACIDLRLSIERKMIAIFRDEHMRKKCGSCNAALDRTARRRSFHDAIASRARKLRTHMADDLEVLRDVLQLLADIFSELTQLATALRAALTMRKVRHDLARQMFSKRLACRLMNFGLWRCCFYRSLKFRPSRLHLFQVQFELPKLDDDLLALGTEQHPSQLLHLQLEMFDVLGSA